MDDNDDDADDDRSQMGAVQAEAKCQLEMQSADDRLM